MSGNLYWGGVPVAPLPPSTSSWIDYSNPPIETPEPPKRDVVRFTVDTDQEVVGVDGTHFTYTPTSGLYVYDNKDLVAVFPVGNFNYIIKSED